ncbi:MAG: hypothetical protein JO112_19625, partial [Planctomycetes bacterium]|nr:hypothetical protein [Planctomycetota bacterium]
MQLRLEALEPRLAPATITWNNPAGGDWGVAGNWKGGVLPGSGDDVVIPNLAAGITIIHSTGTDTVKSLTASEGVTLTGGTLTVTGNLQVSGGVLTLQGGTLAGATATNGSKVV